MSFSVTITADSAGTRAFIVRVQGELRRPRSLNDALGRRLARELQGHFRARNAEPNKMAAEKTNFWKEIAEATALSEVTDEHAIVSIADARFRIHLFGGTIVPTGGRKFLTIPLIPAARGKRAAEYEKATGRKLFRLPGGRALMERDREGGTRSLVSGSTATVRGRGGYRRLNLNARTRIRPVYALAESVTLPEDPRALPDDAKLVAAIQDTATKWIARELIREGGAS